MNRFHRPATPFPQAAPAPIGNQYFIITVTNYPNLLRQTPTYQESPNQQWQQWLRDGIPITNVPSHFSRATTEEHEIILYNTLRFELEECIRAYLQRTGRLYPINLVFDFSHVQQHQQ
ncbi:unnamed protein product [Rotaria sp. Silwood1]|nr:unnamed protein product [Rotaria sp. Silwood1]CAF4991061.1 unnamed protein product [Rotaria sp. Silwood1]